MPGGARPTRCRTALASPLGSNLLRFRTCNGSSLIECRLQKYISSFQYGGVNRLCSQKAPNESWEPHPTTHSWIAMTADSPMDTASRPSDLVKEPATERTDHFLITDCLASGAMWIVYRAEQGQPKPTRPVPGTPEAHALDRLVRSSIGQRCCSAGAIVALLY